MADEKKDTEKKEAAKKTTSSSTEKKKSTEAEPAAFGPSQDSLNPAYAPPKSK